MEQIFIMKMDQKALKKNRIKTNSLPHKYDIQALIDELKKKGNLPLDVMKKIWSQSSSILQKEPNILKLQTPLTIVGDIHGQFFDLIHIFQSFGGVPNDAHYLFLGDYVDRGRFCIEVITLLLLLKVTYPNNIHLLRGNHEGRTMTTYFNFKLQCQTKYNGEMYEMMIDLFINLPLCALINNSYFAVHGGISPSMSSIADIDKINRFVEIPTSGIICDLLWSDPIDEHYKDWVDNRMRNCSYYYSRNQAFHFLQDNNIQLIIRGHQVQMKGYKYQEIDNLPLTLTIFSAPNYCDSYRNKGAVAVLDGKAINIVSFKEVSHPFVLFNYLNAFDLTCPLLAIEIAKIFSNIMKNKNIKRSLKLKEGDYCDILKKIENPGHIIKLLKIDLCKISDILLPEIDDAMIESKCKLANEQLPVIFGPKGLQFVKIGKHQNLDTMDDDYSEKQV